LLAGRTARCLKQRDSPYRYRTAPALQPLEDEVAGVEPDQQEQAHRSGDPPAQMVDNLRIGAPRVESCPLIHDAAIDNAKNGESTDFDVSARRGKAAVAVPGVGAAKDPEDGDQILLGNCLYHRHVEIGEGLDLAARGESR